MNRFARRWCLLMLAAGFAFTSCSNSRQTEAQRVAAKARASRKPAPDFTLTDSNGAKVKLSEYRGKVVLLNFWATWCGPCQVEIPWFIKFQREYKDKDFVVLGVSDDDDGWKAVRPFISSEHINYRVLMANEQVALLYGGI